MTRPSRMPSGGDITLDITSVEYYDTVFALTESPLKQGMLWAGTDDGLIHAHPRRRQDLGERYSQRHAGVEHGQHHRRRALRSRNGVRRH